MSDDNNTREETHNHTQDKEMGEDKEIGKKDRAEKRKKKKESTGRISIQEVRKQR